MIPTWKDKDDCLKCMWYSKRDDDCDMCDYGYPYTINNHGKTPDEVTECNAYRIKRKTNGRLRELAELNDDELDAEFLHMDEKQIKEILKRAIHLIPL